MDNIWDGMLAELHRKPPVPAEPAYLRAKVGDKVRLADNWAWSIEDGRYCAGVGVVKEINPTKHDYDGSRLNVEGPMVSGHHNALWANDECILGIVEEA